MGGEDDIVGAVGMLDGDGGLYGAIPIDGLGLVFAGTTGRHVDDQGDTYKEKAGEKDDKGWFFLHRRLLMRDKDNRRQWIEEMESGKPEKTAILMVRKSDE